MASAASRVSPRHSTGLDALSGPGPTPKRLHNLPYCSSKSTRSISRLATFVASSSPPRQHPFTFFCQLTQRRVLAPTMIIPQETKDASAKHDYRFKRGSKLAVSRVTLGPPLRLATGALQQTSDGTDSRTFHPPSTRLCHRSRRLTGLSNSQSTLASRCGRTRTTSADSSTCLRTTPRRPTGMWWV